MQKGVKQGDPLSPFLFVLAVEGLKQLIDKAISMGFLSGFKPSDDSEVLSILQFADDTLCFLPALEQEVIIFARILRCFEVISGLKINYSKSSLIGIDVPSSFTNHCAGIFNCKVSSLPITYLGVPLSYKKLLNRD